MSNNSRAPNFDFWPGAMIPAWFVTDEHLVIRRSNDFAKQLLSQYEVDLCAAGRPLSFGTVNASGREVESLWDCIIDPVYPSNVRYIQAALRILKEHFAILEEFNNMGAPQNPRNLAERLSAIDEHQHVKPYYYVPADRGGNVCLGIKISPLEGIKLRCASRIENTTVEYIDVVMAYRLLTEWDDEGKLLRSVTFVGAQPAFHDATERHRLWNNLESEKRAQVTGFLSHAFQTPITNIESEVRDLQGARLTEYYQRCAARLLSYVEDLSHLASLLVFISTSDVVTTVMRGSGLRKSEGPETISVDEITAEVAGTLRSILSGRTKNPLNQRKIQILLGVGAVPAPGGKPKRITAKMYQKAAERILNFDGLAGVGTFDLLVDTSALTNELLAKVKTTFLNLLLVEMLINAVKYADTKTPSVRMRLEVDDASGHLNVHVVNNGAALTKEEFENIDMLANKPGEKRKALGLRLNVIAAEKLGWKLNWAEPDEPGTHLILSIPFVR